tara:strand:+ start:38 stop:310 length:273 start_codon:yes stop_codon:yes gene_type:complete
MQVTLNYYDLMDAIEKKLDSTFEGSICLESHDCEISFEITEYDRQPKKHKNGRIMKNKDGNPIIEIVGSQKRTHNFTDSDEITIYISSWS